MKKATLFLLFVFVLPAFSNPHCEKYFSNHLKKEVRYCTHRTQPNQNPTTDDPIIYFFHGMGGSSQSWFDNGFSEQVNKLMGKGYPAMTFVSFDTDWDSFFSDHGANPNGPYSYETWFIKEFMPKMERDIGTCHSRECRATLGLSMGGFGALKTAMRHPELFTAAAAHCPALAPFSIHGSQENWDAYFMRHPIGLTQGGLLLGRIRQIFPSQEIFSHNNPENLLKLVDPGKLPALYFDVGGKDYFGFQEGVAVFKNKLSAKSVQFEDYFDPNEGHEIYKKRAEFSLAFLKRKLAR